MRNNTHSGWRVGYHRKEGRKGRGGGAWFHCSSREIGGVGERCPREAEAGKNRSVRTNWGGGFAVVAAVRPGSFWTLTLWQALRQVFSRILTRPTLLMRILRHSEGKLFAEYHTASKCMAPKSSLAITMLSRLWPLEEIHFLASNPPPKPLGFMTLASHGSFLCLIFLICKMEAIMVPL